MTLMDWPFVDPPNVAVFTLTTIMRSGAPILCVVHDGDDGAWQFLDGTTPNSSAYAMVVSLGEALEHDPSLCELADLPLGWRATRTAPGEPWKRARDVPASG